MVLREYGDCPFRVVKGHIVNFKEAVIDFTVKFAFPKIYPLFNRVP
jgi:hypothetical protein